MIPARSPAIRPGGTSWPAAPGTTALGLTSLEDYELLVLRVCAEEGGNVRTFPPDAVDRCREELASPNPDLGLLNALDEVTIQVGAASLARLGSGDAPATSVAAAPAQPPLAPVPRSFVGSAPPVSAAVPAEAPAPSSPPAPTPAPSPAAAPEVRCRHCAATLPAGRTVVSCPFCGSQLLPVRCAHCKTEVEPGWRFCIGCGRPAGAAGAKP